MAESKPLDVWLKFDSDEDEEPTYEANTFETAWGYEIEWYHTAVGQVNWVSFDRLEEAHKWYADNGFQDFTS